MRWTIIILEGGDSGEWEIVYVVMAATCAKRLRERYPIVLGLTISGRCRASFTVCLTPHYIIIIISLKLKTAQHPTLLGFSTHLDSSLVKLVETTVSIQPPPFLTLCELFPTTSRSSLYTLLSNRL